MQLFARNNLWIRRLLVLATRWLIAVFTQTLCSQCAPVLPHNSTWHQSRSCSHGNKRHKKISGNRYKTQNQGSYIKSQVRVIYVIQNKSVTLNGIKAMIRNINGLIYFFVNKIQRYYIHVKNWIQGQHYSSKNQFIQLPNLIIKIWGWHKVQNWGQL